MRQKLFFLIPVLIVFLIAGLLYAAPRGPEIVMGGYSIFHGTMADMTYVQIEKAAKEKAIILFPVGVIEEHGPHLATGVDTYGAYLKCKMIKGELEKKGIQALIAPPFYWGVNNATGAFAGSFTVREETMMSVLWDTMACLKRWGFEKVFFINHHGDVEHHRPMFKAVQKARTDLGIRAYCIIEDWLAKRHGFTGREHHILIYKPEPSPPSQYLDIHAGGAETSMMWYYLPDLVDLEIWKTLKSTNLTFQDMVVWVRGWEDARKVTPQGYFGEVATASPEHGRKLMEEYAKTVTALIETFLQGQYRPPEIK